MPAAEPWDDRGYTETKPAGDGRMAGLRPLIFGGRICVDYSDAYDYDDFGVALDCFDGWNPEADDEPTGWVRHTPSNRRRPAGNPDREYVAP